jgi:general secretion pathway protein H
MPTSVAGSQKIRGFTLLELLLVVAIIAIASAGASLALRDSAQSRLEMEAQRLAAVLDASRAKARATGVAMHWKASTTGYTVDGTATVWQSSDIVVDAPPQGLLLGPEPMMSAQQVRLSLADQPQRRLSVASDGLRPFSVSSVSQ